MRIIRVGRTGRQQLLRGGAGSPRAATPRERKTVESILAGVKRGGDAALRKYESMFGASGGGPSRLPLRVSPRQIVRAYSAVSPGEISAMRLARLRLARTELATKRNLRSITVGHGGGTSLTRSFVPIASVGCYVPGGSARYPSSAIMSVTPAKVAGVGRIVVASPPGPSGDIDPVTIVAADMCGATEIYRAGGAQVIAAMAYGTRSISKVDKIVGPGGRFVTMAKHLVSSTTPVDMTAGPTELGVIVDSEGEADLAALDLVSQAEHSPDAVCYALTTSDSVAKRIRDSVEVRLQGIGRLEIVRSSLESNGFIAVCRGGPAQVVRLANELAPEHLQIMGGRAERWAGIRGPGLILTGRNSPSAASDYLLGSNHILPTGGSGRARGSLSVLDFVKLLTRVRAGKEDLRRISAPMRAITSAEGLPNHYEAVGGRLAQ